MVVQLFLLTGWLGDACSGADGSACAFVADYDLFSCAPCLRRWMPRFSCSAGPQGSRPLRSKAAGTPKTQERYKSQKGQRFGGLFSGGAEVRDFGRGHLSLSGLSAHALIVPARHLAMDWMRRPRRLMLFLVMVMTAAIEFRVTLSLTLQPALTGLCLLQWVPGWPLMLLAVSTARMGHTALRSAAPFVAMTELLGKLVQFLAVLILRVIVMHCALVALLLDATQLLALQILFRQHSFRCLRFVAAAGGVRMVRSWWAKAGCTSCVA